MRTVAVIGAGGFVGARLIEMARLGAPGLEGCDWIPVIRQYRGLGRWSKFGPTDYRMADLSKPETLRPALKGCQVAVNLTMGDNRRFVGDLQNLNSACAAEGVETLIHLSSAEVYGRCDTPGLTDDSPWMHGHWMEYAREKGKAEDWFRTLIGGGGPTPVLLRPSLIWGPRSPWVANPAQAIHDRTAILIDGGKWACNLCYVDNLIWSIAAVARLARPTAGFYNVGDSHRPTWREYYGALSAAMGRRLEDIPTAPESACKVTMGDRLGTLNQSSLAKAVKRRMKNQTKAGLKAWLVRRFGGGGGTGLPQGPGLNRSTWWLQTTRYHLPVAKFGAAFPGTPSLDFAAAMVPVAAWLRFSGYCEA